MCVEGCFCPEGLIQNSEGKCVPQSDCECYMDDHVYLSGMVVTKDCQRCTCIGGVFNCILIPDCKSQCNEVTEFKCETDDTCIPKAYLCVRINWYKINEEMKA